MDTYNIDEMTASPKKFFDSPKDILAAKKISIKDKKMILNNWKTQCINESVSTNEGMTPAENPEETMLSDVVNALDKLKA